MEYGVIYLKLIPKKGKLSWIKYCHIFSALPEPIQEGIKEVVNHINDKYKDDIIIPMGLDAQLGCVVKSEKVSIISTSIYNMCYNLLSTLFIEPNIRLVYSVGEINNISVKSIHQVYNDEVIIKVGRYLDKSNDVGMFQI